VNKDTTLTVYVDDKKIELPIRIGETVLNVLLDSGVVDVYSPCGGNGLCGKCLVKVIGDDPCPLHLDEVRLLSEEQLHHHLRLSCRMVLSTAADLSISLVDQKNCAKVVSSFQEKGDVDQQKRSFPPSSYGFAIDIGTTTLVVYCVSLQTGEIIDHRSALNPQASYGGDVITRIEYLREHPQGLTLLHDTIVRKLSSLMREMREVYKIQEECVKEIVMVGNPTMIHILARKDPSGIAVAPFTPAFSSRLEMDAVEIGCVEFSKAKIILPGLVSAYIGSDITVGLSASHILRSNKTALYIDIGTNGEIVLFHEGEIYCCSSAAGPAFEGASISQGIGAVKGAIDRVWLDESGDVKYSTIDGGAAIGICGSAVIDIVALLLSLGLVDETGAMDKEHPLAGRYLTISDDKVAFPITEAICFTDRDVREVQLAKAAIAAGCEVLLHENHLDVSSLDSVIIAGGFGSFIHIEKARRIGMLPPISLDKISAIGNAAGKGALQVLLIEGEDEQVEEIRTRSQYIELSTSKLFNELFIEQMMFGECDNC
jgi:uncharacterized 2Fe-2S/4Fe-4S cluster protein (DUF4445 family)